ncbi:uncharacterized protein LOC129410103 [Boleophthalmus pectinirostris]|uniref:uncharacterized protein LOC129410103 n=1 Tax=Boleophthalmus pectinirostris TaxID=150288 RepID=UPI002430BECE|nr:uncharacterized protein LOC129410103 [Boleophthalmus pectinirostris]
MSVSSGTEPPAAVLGLGLDTGGGPWLQRQKYGSSVSVQTYSLNSGTVPAPPPPTAVGARVRLPALTAKGPRRKSGMARLSLSEPSLFPHNDSVLFGGLSCACGPNLLHKRAPVSSSFIKPSTLSPNPPPPLPQDHSHPQGTSRPLYLHFSRSIQPSLKTKAKRRHSHTVSSEFRTAASQVSPLSESLSVVGKTCLPVCTPRPTPAAVSGPSRPHLHVFLPSEAEGEDSESVDEGFMDELDHKMSSLKLQQAGPQTVALHCNQKNWSHSCLD